jgi:hypothetical protein
MGRSLSSDNSLGSNASWDNRLVVLVELSSGCIVALGRGQFNVKSGELEPVGFASG